MSELCFPNTSKIPQFSSLLISYLIRLCSLILSQPLYFSYFIFFSPYLVTLLLILSPLFITTSLLHLTFVTLSCPDIIQEHPLSQLSETKLSFFVKIYYTMLEGLPGRESDFLCLGEFESLKIVSDPSALDFGGSPADVLDLTTDEESCFYDFGAPTFCSLSRESESAADETSRCEESGNKLEENCGESAPVEIGIKDAMEERTSEVFFKELDKFDSMTSNAEVEKDHESSIGAESKKIVKIVVETDTRGKSLLGGSEAEIGDDKISDTLINAGTNVSAPSQRLVLGEFVNSNGPDNAGRRTPKVESPRALEYNIWSYCSMRKEKEWKRTLACKLFEEIHNNIEDGSGEGMDLLWETYEMDSSTTKPKSDIVIKKNSKNEEKTKKLFDYDDKMEDMVGPFCCLGALKSAGKLNLGMGRSDLFRIFRTVKWCRWLHRVIRHSKKIHHGD